MSERISDNGILGSVTADMLAASVAIAVVAFLAFVPSGHSALLAVALQSFVGASSQGLMLIGAQRNGDAGRPAAEPYFWSFLVAILLSGLGAGVALYDGTQKLLLPGASVNVAIAVVVLLLALSALGFTTWSTVRELRRARSSRPAGPELTDIGRSEPGLYVVVIEGIAGLVGMVLALAGLLAASMLAWPAADGLAAIAIGLVMAGIAALMCIEVRRLLPTLGDTRTVSPREVDEPARSAGGADASRQRRRTRH